MKINDIFQPGSVQPTRGPATRAVTPPEVKPAQPEGSLGTDRADLRTESRIEAQVFEAAKLVYEALPDVRSDKVALAKQRLAQGFYDRPEVQEQIAARLAADPAVRPTPELSLEQQAAIRQRLAEGFYDSPEAVEKIAGGLAKEAEG